MLGVPAKIAIAVRPWATLAWRTATVADPPAFVMVALLCWRRLTRWLPPSVVVALAVLDCCTVVFCCTVTCWAAAMVLLPSAPSSMRAARMRRRWGGVRCCSGMGLAPGCAVDQPRGDRSGVDRLVSRMRIIGAGVARPPVIDGAAATHLESID
jgi:hypothetical protein